MTRQQTTLSNKTFITSLLAGLLCACLAVPALAGVKARLDRDKVYAGDPVILIIESDGRQSGEPDLSALDKDFRVTGNSTSSQVSIINGRRSDKTTWTVQLEPRRKGTLQIPPVSVGGEQSRPLTLEVTDIPEPVATDQAGHVFLEVEADTDGQSLYVQQQIPYTVRLYYDDQVLSGELEGPHPEQAVVEQLGEDQRYSVMRNGRLYNVLERHYAISAEKNGPFTIPPASFSGQIAASRNMPAPGGQQGRLFDRFFQNSPFANDPFFSRTPFAAPGQALRIHSEAINLDIQPRPAGTGNTWLPAEQLVLQDSWADSPPQLRSGEPATRTLTLQARGLTGPQLPVLQLEPPAQARLYPETPVHESRTDGDTVFGISKQTFTYIPEKAGMLTIPAVELDWWNTRTNQAERTRLPPWELNAEPGRGGPSVPPPVKADTLTQTRAADTPAPAAPAPSTTWAEDVSAFKHWPLAGAALLLLSIVLLAAKWLRQPRPAPAAPPGPSTKDLLLQLERACTANDAGAAAHTLLELGRRRWPNDPPRNLGALATRLEQANAPIMALDRALYAAGSVSWNGADLFTAVKTAWRKKPAGEKTVEVDLKPLYPQ